MYFAFKSLLDLTTCFLILKNMNLNQIIFVRMKNVPCCYTVFHKDSKCKFHTAKDYITKYGAEDILPSIIDA